MISGRDNEKAQELLDMALDLSEAGRDDEAIIKYKEAIELDPTRPALYYDIGLIYKYRNDWRNSFAFNLKANELDPDDEAARWNLAIAATALRDWATARRAWADNGLAFEDAGSGPIEADFGSTPVRLNPDGDGEVVWGRRIDPVRLRIESIPFPESGFRCADVVLHDGAPMGSCTANGREYAVFNVLELFEPSALATFRLDFEAASVQVVDALCQAFRDAGLSAEDWTGSVALICRQCSEGTRHQHAPSKGPDVWEPQRSMGVSASAFADIEAVLAAWSGPSLGEVQLSCALEGLPS